MPRRKNVLLSGVAVVAAGFLFTTLPTTNASLQDVRSGQLTVQIVVPEPIDPQPSLQIEQLPSQAPVAPVKSQPVPEPAVEPEPQPASQPNTVVPVESPPASPTPNPEEVHEPVAEVPLPAEPSDEPIAPPIEEEEEIHETNTP